MEADMNWDVIESNWKQFTDVVKEQWSKLTDDHVQRIAGRRDRLGAEIATMYGVSNEEAEKQLQSFETSNITYKGGIKARTYARITSAEADYMIATTECGTRSGSEKDLCMRDAESRQAKTISDASANKDAVEARTQGSRVSLDTRRPA
jgi:uncharacterized protein YjbJ (UPF0337 family)